MFLPLVEDRLLDVILRHVMLSVFTGVFWLLLALLLLRLLRVKNPGIRYLFLFIPLLKSAMALVRELPEVRPFNGVVIVNAQFPSFKIIPDWVADIVPAEYEPSLTIGLIPTATILGVALAFFGWRLAGLIRFQRLLASAEEVSRDDYADFFRIVDRLVADAGVRYPKLIVIQNGDTPFTVGLKRPVIAFSPNLLERLDAEEIKAVLAHEIAHIVRKDYLYHWPVVLIRDVLFFNPITPFVYRRLNFERERACDDMGSNLSKPLALAKSLVKVAEIQRVEPAATIVRAFAPQSLLSTGDSHLTARVKQLVDPAPYVSPGPAKQLLIGVAAFFFFYVEIHVAANLAGRLLVLT
jgi:beta-lactamase regulating signal transducer with metallopeptidase domain